MASPKRIPFDSLTLAAVVCELRPLVGAKLQRIWQLDESTVLLGFYAERKETFLLLSCDARFFRAHLAERVQKGISPPPPFCQALRKALTDSRLSGVWQVGLDRILRLEFESAEGGFTLIAELMGKHSNLLLVGPDHKVHGAAKWVGSSKSRRPITPGRTYEPPPFAAKEPMWHSQTWEALRIADGSSPFLLELVARQSGLEEAPETGPLPESALKWLSGLRSNVDAGEYAPVMVEGVGAYPVSVAALGFVETRIESLSAGLEPYYAEVAGATSVLEARSSLLAQLKRVLLAREVAVRSLEEAADTAKRAGKLQLMGELLISYAGQAPQGASKWETEDWGGNAVSIPLNPDQSALENAQRLFDRAKRAKAGAGEVKDQLARQRADVKDISALIQEVESADSPEALDRLREDAAKRRWLNVPTIAEKEDRPFQGHRIRELAGPGGWQVLYGENATSNDYLTQRVAKPNDWWLHVRGAASAHVVIPTANKPEKVPREALEFAARVAAKQSASKHSSVVAVDYTLKKYVRKPKGSAPGAALYEREKTLHVSPA